MQQVKYLALLIFHLIFNQYLNFIILSIRLPTTKLSSSAVISSEMGTKSSTFIPAATWTQKFYCLGKVKDSCIPDKEYDVELILAGLSLNKIKFEDKRGDDYFIDVSCKEFTNLKSQNGGLCVWRCSARGSGIRSLEKLNLSRWLCYPGNKVSDKVWNSFF